jgi:outer membrane receptor protein involved in Fe transport
MRNEIGHDITVENQSAFDPVKDYFQIDGRLSYEFKRAPVAAVAAVTSKDSKESKAVAGTGATAAVYSPFDRLLDGLRLTVGCNNIADEEPRYINGGNSATNLAVYDPYGRFVYFEIAHKF